MTVEEEGVEQSISDAATITRGPKGRLPWIVIGGGSVLVLAAGFALVRRADRGVNHVPLAAAPRPVAVVEAEGSSYRGSRSYVGTIQPWIQAEVGPQYASGYVDTVLVRPGAEVKRGEVLATLDCSDENAASQAIAMRARAIDEHRRALSDEAARVGSLVDRGFVGKNEAEVSEARGASAQAELLEAKAKLTSASLRVKDCVLRAPFAGEIGSRSIDPGAFVRPGASIVTVVDRGTVRIVGDAPEKDFGLIAPSTPVKIDVLATGTTLSAKVSRRAPKADDRTRTVHFEIDVSDPERTIPVGTTGIVELDVGTPIAASVVPAYAATVRAGKARIFVVEGGTAHAREAGVVGESAGLLYLDPKAVPPGAKVVTQGRALLSDGDLVQARAEAPVAPPEGSGAARGGGYGRPL